MNKFLLVASFLFVFIINNSISYACCSYGCCDCSCVGIVNKEQAEQLATAVKNECSKLGIQANTFDLVIRTGDNKTIAITNSNGFVESAKP